MAGDIATKLRSHSLDGSSVLGTRTAAEPTAFGQAEKQKKLPTETGKVKFFERSSPLLGPISPPCTFGMLGRGKTKAEVEAEDEKKRKKREEKRAVKRAEARTELESKDILDVGKSQFKESVGPCCSPPTQASPRSSTRVHRNLCCLSVGRECSGLLTRCSTKC